MNDCMTHMSMRKAAVLVGCLYLAMFILSMFGYFYVVSRLIVEGDAAATTQNIIANELLFRSGTASLLIIAVLDIVIALGLYVFLRPAGKSLSLLAAWLRVAYAAVFIASLANLVAIPGLLQGADYLGDQLQTQVLMSFNAFDTGWMVSLLFFGFHLLGIGYLVFKSGYVPRVVGVLLVIAALGYLVDTLGTVALPNYNLPLGEFTFIGELVFPVWLLVRGGKQTVDERPA